MACKSSTEIITDEPKRPLQQESPLLKLPAELRNRIYELAVPNNTFISLRADRVTDPSGSGNMLRYHFTPSTGLLSACQGTRNDILEMYYSTNTFLITDSTLPPVAFRAFAGAFKAFAGAFKVFAEASKEGARLMRKLRVSLRVGFLCCTCRSRPVWKEEACCEITFVAERTAAGTTLRNFRTRRLCSDMRWNTPSDLCSCTLEKMFAKHDQGSATSEESLLDVVARYVDLAATYAVESDRSDAPIIRVPLCDTCGKLQPF